MTIKQFLKNWILHYIRPEFLYLPSSSYSILYNVEFQRYANIKNNSGYSSDSYRDMRYVIRDEIYYPKETTEYYIYDEQGYYYSYNSDGTYHKDKQYKQKLTANTIKLPRGKYFYKEMRSLYGCKLIENVIPFTVAGDNTIVVTHHEANMLRVDYHVELETIHRKNVIETFVKEEIVDRQQHYGDNLYTVEAIIDRERLAIDPDLPIIKIDKIASYKNDYSKNVQLNVAYYISTYITDTWFSEKANADYLLPRTQEDYNLTYVKTWGWHKYQNQWFYYNFIVNNNEYSDDFIYENGSRYISNLASYGKQDGEQYNESSETDLFWIHYPDDHVLNEPYIGYKARTYINSGFQGRVTQSKIIGKNTVDWKTQLTVRYRKQIDIYVDPKTGEKTMTEEEHQPEISKQQEKLLDNFNEIHIFSYLLGRLDDDENISLGTIYLYKEKGNDLTCYYSTGITKENLEVRRVENGLNIENKDADAMYVGALIAVEERQEDDK